MVNKEEKVQTYERKYVLACVFVLRSRLNKTLIEITVDNRETKRNLNRNSLY